MDATASHFRSPVEGYALDPRRWLVLACFAVVNCNQCLGNMTFSSLSQETLQEYFGPSMDKAMSDTLLNWGPWFGMLFFVPAMWVSSRPGGLKKALGCGASAVLLGHAVRMLPVLARELGGDAVATRAAWAYGCYHVGQIFIAVAGPFNMGAVTLLSAAWFAERERTTATAIAQTSNSLGATLAYLNPMWLSPSAAQIPNLFYAGLALSVVPCLALLWLPARPTRLPSAAAEAALSGGDHWQELRQVRQLLTNRSLLLLIATVGVFSGSLGGWSSVFQSMLGPEGVSEAAVGWMGFGNCLAENAAGIAIGLLFYRCFHRRLKAGILFGLCGCVLCLVLFTLSLSSFGRNAPASLLPHSNGSLAALAASVGFFQGCATPLFYELSAELMYPAKESTSAGLIVFVVNVTFGVMVFLNSYLRAENMNYTISAIVAGLFFIVSIGVREQYKRPRDQEKHHLMGD